MRSLIFISIFISVVIFLTSALKRIKVGLVTSLLLMFVSVLLMINFKKEYAYDLTSINKISYQVSISEKEHILKNDISDSEFIEDFLTISKKINVQRLLFENYTYQMMTSTSNYVTIFSKDGIIEIWLHENEGYISENGKIIKVSNYNEISIELLELLKSNAIEN